MSEEHENISFKHPGLQARFGLKTVDITPPVGVYARCWGAALHDTAEQIHQPLKLTALTISALNGNERMVFLDADLGWWQSMEIFQRIQSQILSTFELESRQLIFAITHTHAGPPLTQLDPALPGAQLQQQWLTELTEKILAAIKQASANTFEGLLEWNLGQCSLASQRDLPDPAENSERFLCGYNPQGSADSTLLVGRVTDRSGQVQAVLVNYACHPTTLAWENVTISPDFPGAMKDLIKQQTGATAFFLQGASGELAPRYQYTGDPAVAERHGRQLGYAALACLENMEPPETELVFTQVMESGAPLAVWKHQNRSVATSLQAMQSAVEVPLKNWPTAADFEQQFQECSDRTLAERIRRKRDIRRSLGDGSTCALPFWLWKLGEVLLIGSPAEAYSQLQQELRSSFPDQLIVCMNLINGSNGYLPPRSLYEQDIYPVMQTPFDAGALELTISAMKKQIHQIS